MRTELSRFATRHGLNLIFDGNIVESPAAPEDCSSFAMEINNEKTANPYWAIIPHRSNEASVA
jgi:hypothetical protein